jgi:hypothetical protein
MLKDYFLNEVSVKFRQDHDLCQWKWFTRTMRFADFPHPMALKYVIQTFHLLSGVPKMYLLSHLSIGII